MSTADELIVVAKERRLLPPPPERRNIRQQSNLTQEECASALNTTAGNISHWERGTREPRGSLRAAYAALLERLRREVLSS